MNLPGYNHRFGQKIMTDIKGADIDRAFLAHFRVAATAAATCVLTAASAETDVLTVSGTAAVGARANDLSILLTTAEDDTLAVTGDDETGVITIALADTTASKNTAALIQTAIRALTTVPYVPRNITATAGGTAGDIGAIQVTITGTNYADEVITEDLPAFTVDTSGTVTGSKAFKTVTQISVPAHDGDGATTSIGFGDKLGLPYMLPHNTVLLAALDNTREATAPTVATDADEIEKNTIDLNSALDGSQVDVYLMV